ncbi:MAG: hypothetical protein IH840_02890 [Candidatus Heimdallarchaeota archaeon]|nr:hypothetical protein [Candidatus Heimdallarchaeota archaeon]
MEDAKIDPQELSEEIKELLPYLKKIKDFELRLNFNIAKTVNFIWGILFLFAGVLDYVLAINDVSTEFVWSGVVIIGFFIQTMIDRQSLLYAGEEQITSGKPWIDLALISLSSLFVIVLIQSANKEFIQPLIWLTNAILALWKKENDLYDGWGCITDNIQRNIIGFGSLTAAVISYSIVMTAESFEDIAGLISGVVIFLSFLTVYLFNRNKQLNLSISH